MTIIYLMDTWQDFDTPEGTVKQPACLGIFDIVNYTDVAGADTVPPPNPNIAICMISDGPELVAAIEAHPDYGPGAILYVE